MVFHNYRKNPAPAVQVSGGKDTPIVIDDEEEFKQTVEQATNLVIPGVVTPTPINIAEKTQPRPPQHEVSADNTRRRPLILEKPGTIRRSNNEVKISEGWCFLFCLW
jgi:hypothetical protein